MNMVKADSSLQTDMKWKSIVTPPSIFPESKLGGGWGCCANSLLVVFLKGLGVQ